jgi:hypothetical protein
MFTTTGEPMRRRVENRPLEEEVVGSTLRAESPEKSCVIY